MKTYNYCIHGKTIDDEPCLECEHELQIWEAALGFPVGIINDFLVPVADVLVTM
jgi:hypothetical protein